LSQLRERYGAAPFFGAELLSVGDAPRDASIDVVELAAWTQLTITILASDIAILMY
jgi:hypothetical protein